MNCYFSIRSIFIIARGSIYLRWITQGSKMGWDFHLSRSLCTPCEARIPHIDGSIDKMHVHSNKRIGKGFREDESVCLRIFPKGKTKWLVDNFDF